MDDFSMDWDQEIQDMVDDLLLDALVLELCRLAAARAPSGCTSPRMTSAPSRAYMRAMAKPMPWAAPVTMAI